MLGATLVVMATTSNRGNDDNGASEKETSNGFSDVMKVAWNAAGFPESFKLETKATGVLMWLFFECSPPEGGRAEHSQNGITKG